MKHSQTCAAQMCCTVPNIHVCSSTTTTTTTLNNNNSSNSNDPACPLVKGCVVHCTVVGNAQPKVRTPDSINYFYVNNKKRKEHKTTRFNELDLQPGRRACVERTGVGGWANSRHVMVTRVNVNVVGSPSSRVGADVDSLFFDFF